MIKKKLKIVNVYCNFPNILRFFKRLSVFTSLFLWKTILLTFIERIETLIFFQQSSHFNVVLVLNAHTKLCQKSILNMLWIIMLTLYTALINGQNTLDIFSRNSFIFFLLFYSIDCGLSVIDLTLWNSKMH